MTALDTAKLAIVYARQSTPGQVQDNVEATREQFKLREIPIARGFAEDRVLVVDDDLGVSGATIVGRKGMLRVLELVERGAVACVVVRDIGRLTRDEFNADIGLIARACAGAGALIVTPGKDYDPTHPDDLLALGVQGLLAGWDRGQIVRRLEHHRRARQARGCMINGAVPVGYEPAAADKRSPDYGKLAITSNAAVRERIALILSLGRELGGVYAVVRHLREHELLIPVGRAPSWVPATKERVTRILKNPAYAGAIVNGRKGSVRRPNGQRAWVTRPYSQCTVIRDAHPGYITWEEHHALLAAIARNNQAKVYSTGAALISGLGLAKCGVCEAAMTVSYNNPTRRDRRRGGAAVPTTPYNYVCSREDDAERRVLHQNPAGPRIDAAVTMIILDALGAIDLSGAREAMADRDRQADETERQRAQKVTALARRAEMLEAALGDATSAEVRRRIVLRLEDAVAALKAARQEAAAPVPHAPAALTPEVLARLEVFQDPAAAWEQFTPATRKEIVRALAGRLTVYPDFDGYYVVVDWQGGGRAAAKVKTVQRRKLFPVPADVLAMFDDAAAAAPAVRFASRRTIGTCSECGEGPKRLPYHGARGLRCAACYQKPGRAAKLAQWAAGEAAHRRMVASSGRGRRDART